MQVDKDGIGSISLSEYFGIFSAHSIVVDKVETNRVIRLAGEDGNLSKDKFVKIVQGSDFFMKSFDKNKDGEVTEVRIILASNKASTDGKSLHLYKYSNNQILEYCKSIIQI